MKPIQKVEFHGNLVPNTTGDNILFTIVDGNTRIEGECRIVLMKSHESTQVVVDRDVHVHPACDTVDQKCQMACE